MTATPAVAEDPRAAIPRPLARRGDRLTAPRRAAFDALATSHTRAWSPSSTAPSAAS